ncbi:MAG: hypothetical protein GC191_12685 [Azospirillum sp.]|nr:hypothetical protein [Azospirillum sp.]
MAGEPSKAEVGGVSCLVLGAASVGVVLVAGPLQLAATVAGATLGAPSPALVAGLIGAAFAAGCAVGALTVPALIWAENAGGQMSVQVADGLAVVNRRLGRPFDSGTTAPAVSGGRS